MGRKFVTRNSNRKKLIINFSLFLLIIMGVGFSTLGTNLNIFGTIDIKKYESGSTLYGVMSSNESSPTNDLVLKYDGDHNDLLQRRIPDRQVYYFNSETEEDSVNAMNNNNVIFADQCWQIIRTTDTGGVKLLYNGEAEDGKCLDTRDNHVGYSSNNRTVHEINGTYFYSDSYEYDKTTDKFSLSGDKEQTIWNSSTSKDLVGKYTCLSEFGSDSCSKIYLVEAYDTDNTAYLLELDSNANYSTLGNIEFNKVNTDLPSSVGYMYGESLKTETKDLKKTYDFMDTYSIIYPLSKDYNVWFANSLENYDNIDNYCDRLVDPFRLNPGEDFSSLIGKYTINSIYRNDDSCTVFSNARGDIYPTYFKIIDVDNDYLYAIRNGLDFNGRGLYISDSEDGTCTPVQYSSWYTNHNNYVGSYLCDFDSESEEMIPVPEKKILKTTKTNVYFLSDALLWMNDVYAQSYFYTYSISDIFNNFDFYLEAHPFFKFGVSYDNDDYTIIEEKYNTKYLTGYLYDADPINGIFTYLQNYYLGSGIYIDGSKYKLNDYITIGAVLDDNLLTNHRYICLKGDYSDCSEFGYVYDYHDGIINYIKIPLGVFNIDELISNNINNNVNNSTIKLGIDAWYKKYLEDYSSYIEDVIYCNNRTIKEGNLWSSSSDYSNKTLTFQDSTISNSLVCPYYRYSYNNNNSVAQLDYKIGLLTASEMNLYSNYFLSKSSDDFWLLTPSSFCEDNNCHAGIYYVDSETGEIKVADGTNSSGLRPVISLNSNTEFESGNGSKEEPFVVLLEESYNITNDSEVFTIIPSAKVGKKVKIKSDEYKVTSFKLNGTLVNGDSFVMPSNDVNITDIVYTSINKNITCNVSSVTVPSTAKIGKNVYIIPNDNSKVVTGFIINNVYHEGNSFVMPYEDVFITNVILSNEIIIESAHRPYDNTKGLTQYYENTFEDASYISVELEYMLNPYDYILFYDEDNTSKPIKMFYEIYEAYFPTFSFDRITNKQTFIIDGDYIKIALDSNSAATMGLSTDMFGFKAKIVPHYDGNVINCSNENVHVANRAKAESKVKIKSDIYTVSSFKLNGKTILGNSFVMPNEDVTITDIVLDTPIIVESEHYPYLPSLSNEIYYENSFVGADYITIELEANLEYKELNPKDYSAPRDNIKIYDSRMHVLSTIDNEFYHNTILINGNYVKITFTTTDDDNEAYGFKAKIVPHYDGHSIINNSGMVLDIPSKAYSGANITLSDNKYVVTSFKMNDQLIEGDSFEMPYEDVIITDVVRGYGFKYNERKVSYNSIIYEQQFQDAQYLIVTLSTKFSSENNYLYLYDSPDGEPIGKYLGKDLQTKKIIIDGNYIKATLYDNYGSNKNINIVVEPCYSLYDVIVNDSSVVSSIEKAREGNRIYLTSKNSIITSFKLNNVLVEGNSFVMPNCNANITDINKVYGAETNHYPYKLKANEVLFENSFEGATYLTIDLTYQTESSNNDYVTLYYKNNNSIDSKIFGGVNKNSEEVVVNGNYLKIKFNSDDSSNNYYGFRAVVTPHYDGYNINCTNPDISVISKASPGTIVDIDTPNIVVESFKINGKLIYGSKFVMPSENVTISDVNMFYGAETNHDNYEISDNNIYFEKEFEGASYLTVDLIYEFKLTSDYLYLYDSVYSPSIDGRKYTSTTLTNDKEIRINSNYLRILFHSSSGINQKYGFRAVVTPHYDGYNIVCDNNNVEVLSKSYPGNSVYLKSSNKIIESFKLNNELIEGNSFVMPEENVSITDVVLVEGAETLHNPYYNNQSKVVYYEKTFIDATYLTIDLTYQTENYNDKVYIYKNNNELYSSYYGTTLKNTSINLYSNYLKIAFDSNGSGNNYYGFKAIVTPHYDGNKIICNDSEIDVPSLVMSGDIIDLSTSSIIVNSFKIDGVLINGSTFTMPDRDVVITEINKSYVSESGHNPYPNSMRERSFIDTTYEGATSLNVELTYQTDGGSDKVNISYYPDNVNMITDTYTGTSLMTEDLVIPGNRIKITMTSDSSSNNYYGYRAIITPNYGGYNINCSDKEIILPSKSISGVTFDLNIGGYIVESFKLNGELIEGNIFEMPDKDIYITEVSKKYIVESNHNPYNYSTNTYLDKQFKDADYLTIDLTYQTIDRNSEYIVLFSGNDNYSLVGRYGGRTLTNETIVVDGDHLKIQMIADDENYMSRDYYGFKAIITPHYDGKFVVCSNNDVSVVEKSRVGRDVYLYSKIYDKVVTSFKLNDELVEGNMFIMPDSNAVITDVVFGYGQETKHKPYEFNKDKEKYFEEYFEGASYLTVDLTYQTFDENNYIYLYDNKSNSSLPLNDIKYYGQSLKHKEITVDSNYLKILFNSNFTPNNLYGFRAVVTPHYEGYNINCDNNNVNLPNKAFSNRTIRIKSKRVGYLVTSFRLNGTLIENNEFEMPDEEVTITDIVESFGVESDHYPYGNSLNNSVYYTKLFEGASSVTVDLKYQTENIQNDWISIYDSPISDVSHDKLRYGGLTLQNSTINLKTNYVKIVFNTDESNNNYYGFKAIITPHYDGYEITCSDNRLLVKNNAESGSLVKLQSKFSHSIIKSFKLNGTLINGDTFIMPSQNVEITDVVMYYSYYYESNYLECGDSIGDNYFEKRFNGASYIKVKLTYRTSMDYIDRIVLFDDTDHYSPLNGIFYSSSTEKTEYITIQGEYFKLYHYHPEYYCSDIYGYKVELYPYYDGYNIINTDSNFKISSKARQDSIIKIDSGEYGVSSFRVNGELIEGNTFIMPNQDVTITDIVKYRKYIFESDYYYDNEYNDFHYDEVIFENTFENATYLTIDLNYSTYDINSDYLEVFDGITTKNYGGANGFLKRIYIDSNYVKITSYIEGGYGYYGIITPHYDGYTITNTDTVISVASKARAGGTVKLYGDGYVINSFRVNGILYEGDTFIMPEENVIITDIDKKEDIILKSNNDEYGYINPTYEYETIFDRNFVGASYVVLNIKCQTSNIYDDYVDIFGDGVKVARYGGSDLTEDTLIIDSSRITVKTMFSYGGDYFGYWIHIEPHYDGYNITNTDSNINVKSIARAGSNVVLSSDNYFVESFRVNDTLVEGDTFVMPEEDVIITDISKILGDVVESQHNPYDKDIYDRIYYSKKYYGASSILVKLKYQLDSDSGDYLTIYDSVEEDNPLTYSNDTLTSEDITINSDYIKIKFNSNNSDYEYYGFKAVVIPRYAGYNISYNDSNLFLPPKASEGMLIKFVSNNYVVKSFKLNGTLINGDSFTMPGENVEITDIVKVLAYTVETQHYPYLDDQSNEVYFESTFAGATSITVELTYQTESNYDYVYLYDQNDSYEYGGETLTTETITITGNYLKIEFYSDSSCCDFYGFKAVITPNY